MIKVGDYVKFVHPTIGYMSVGICHEITDCTALITYIYRKGIFVDNNQYYKLPNNTKSIHNYVILTEEESIYYRKLATFK